MKAFCTLPPTTSFLAQLAKTQSSEKMTRSTWRSILNAEVNVAPPAIAHELRAIIAAENRSGSTTDPTVVGAANKLTAILENCSTNR